MRTDINLLKKFCKELPKGGMLHVHPSGTITREVAHDILKLNNPHIDHATVHSLLNPWFALHEYAFLEEVSTPTRYLDLDPKIQNKFLDLHVLPDGNGHSFSRFIGLFIIQGFYRNNSNHITIAELLIKNFLSQAKEHGVIYVEFNNHSVSDYPIIAGNLAQLASHVEEWEQQYGITIRFNYAFLRVNDLEITHKQASDFLELDSPYITGIDLLGDETNTHAFEKGQAIYATVNAAVADTNKNIKCTMHAGELGDTRNPRDAMILGAQRIGHGVGLIHDVVSLEYARRQQLGIETNIISNKRLGVHADSTSHPFLDYLRLGLKPSLSTDDEGMFATNISNEFFVAIMETDISYAEVKQLVLNSIDTSFADLKTKNRLRETLLKQLAIFEQKWCNLHV